MRREKEAQLGYPKLNCLPGFVERSLMWEALARGKRDVCDSIFAGFFKANLHAEYRQWRVQVSEFGNLPWREGGNAAKRPWRNEISVVL